MSLCNFDIGGKQVNHYEIKSDPVESKKKCKKDKLKGAYTKKTNQIAKQQLKCNLEYDQVLNLSKIREGTGLKTSISNIIRSYYENDRIFYRLYHDPYKYLDEINQDFAKARIENGVVTISEPSLFFLKICPCKKMTPELRMKLEEFSIDLLTQSYPTSSPLTIVTVGPGACYQELIYLAKLARAGYSKLRLVLIEPGRVNIGAFEVVCERQLPCKIEIVKFDSLKEYVEKAIENVNLIPNLLLMIDLSDKKYDIEGQSLPDYTFSLFKENNLIEKGTVISYSTLDTIMSDFKTKFTPKAICCSYDGVSDNLSEIDLNRKEQAGDPVEEKSRR